MKEEGPLELEHEYTLRRAIRDVAREQSNTLKVTQAGAFGLAGVSMLVSPGFGPVVLWLILELMTGTWLGVKSIERQGLERRLRRVDLLAHATRDVSSKDLVRLTSGQHMTVRARLAFGSRRRGFMGACTGALLFTLLHMLNGMKPWSLIQLFVGLLTIFNTPLILLSSFETLFPKLENRPELEQTIKLERKKRTVENVHGGLSLTTGTSEDEQRGALTPTQAPGGLTQTE